MKIKPLKHLLFVPVLLLAISSTHGQPVLEQYIREGLTSNIVLRQKNLTHEQAKQSLGIARSYFLPSVNVLADYTSGKGGREIAIPMGDLLNPVYTTLNQLTESQAFPQVENVSQDFFPYDFYDARIRTSLPLINTDLYINRSIHQQKVVLSSYDIAAYERELVLEIKKSYYQYLASVEAVKIYESAIVLLTKNVQVNESLVKNGKSLPAYHLRSKSELEKVKADLNTASNNVDNARRYFNFLLNRSLETDIVIDQSVPDIEVTDAEQETSIDNREEVFMLKTAEEIQSSALKLHQYSALPKMNAFVDLGSQATNWQFNNSSRYYLLGVQLTVPVFQGFRNRVQIRQARHEVEKSVLETQNTMTRLRIAADIASADLRTSIQNYRAAQEQLYAARSYYHLVDKGYSQGVNTLIEFIDARNQLTTSELQLNVRHFQVLIAQASLERETASFDLSRN